jgi:hypothetical protein
MAGIAHGINTPLGIGVAKALRSIISGRSLTRFIPLNADRDGVVRVYILSTILLPKNCKVALPVRIKSA